MPNDQALSPQDIQDLQGIAAQLKPGDPRVAKVSKLLSSQPTQFELDRQPSQQQGGALGRFGGGLYNSTIGQFVDAAKQGPDTSVWGALKGGAPVLGVAQSIAQGFSQQGSQAIQSAKQGNYSEAGGHALASVTPFFGPQAAQAGQQIGSGDIAGGLGTATGVLGTATLPTTVGVVSDAAKAGFDRLAGVPKALSDAADTHAAEMAKQADVIRNNKMTYSDLEMQNQTAQEAAKSANIANYKAIEQEAANDKAALDADNVKKLQQYRQSTSQAIRDSNTNKVLTSRRQALETSAQKLAPRIQGHLQDVSNTIYNDLQSRYSNINTAVGDSTIDPTKSANAVRHAASSIVQPANLEQFRAAVQQAFGESNAMDWKGAQAVYSNLGNIIADGNMSNDVLRGLQHVQQQGVGSAMQDIANQHGVGDLLAKTRSDYSQYMTDFRNSGAVARGGSPIAQALRSPDPQTALNVLSGPASDRAAQILSKYKDYGANPDLIGLYKGLKSEAAMLPKAASQPNLPNYPNLKTPQDVTMAPYKPGPADLTQAPYKSHPVEPVDTKAVTSNARKAFAKKAGKAVAGTVGAAGAYEFAKHLF